MGRKNTSQPLEFVFEFLVHQNGIKDGYRNDEIERPGAINRVTLTSREQIVVRKFQWDELVISDNMPAFSQEGPREVTHAASKIKRESGLKVL